MANAPGFLSGSVNPTLSISSGWTGPMPGTRLPNAVGMQSASGIPTSRHSPLVVGSGARYENAIRRLFV